MGHFEACDEGERLRRGLEVKLLAQALLEAAIDAERFGAPAGLEMKREQCLQPLFVKGIDLEQSREPEYGIVDCALCPALFSEVEDATIQCECHSPCL